MTDDQIWLYDYAGVVVSAEVATEMAEGAKDKANADMAIAITGIAGPTGGSASKPIGLVFIAVATDEQTIVERYEFSGERDEVRQQAVEAALGLALTSLT